ncbi:MAG: hypothetical protein FWG73_09235 [Planctomycetaceae bacterium]|nr:hypothetical protein [Planctomycetaceae bacterium]
MADQRAIGFKFNPEPICIAPLPRAIPYVIILANCAMYFHLMSANDFKHAMIRKKIEAR